MGDGTTPGLDTGLRIDTGDGPRPVTAKEWNESLARMAWVHRGSVVPADDDARRDVERVHPRRDPETRRLLALRRLELRPGTRAPDVSRHVRQPRSRAPRSRRLVGAARAHGPPSRPGDEDPEPPQLALRGAALALARFETRRRRRASRRWAA